MNKLKIWIALLVTLVLAYFSPSEKDEGKVPAVFQSKDDNKQRAFVPQGLEELNPRESNQVELSELKFFSAKAGVVTDVEKVTLQTKKVVHNSAQSIRQATDEIQLQAPPLPFKLLGTYTENDRQVIFLQHENQNIALQIGETILEKYRLEAIEANALTFTYLPMDIKQTLALSNQEKL